MRRQINIRTRTLLLIAVAVVVAAQGLSLFLSLHRNDGETTNPNDFDFVLSAFGEPGGIEYEEGFRPELPLFEPWSNGWTLDGRPLSEFASLMEGLEVGPHGSSPFIVIALPENATVGDYRKSLASLAWHGICRVGVYSPSADREFVSLRFESAPSDRTFVPVYRVLKVKLDTGATLDCTERFPAWAPWVMYPH